MPELSLRVNYGKRKQTYKVSIDNLRCVDFRSIIKERLKLQIPKELLTIENMSQKGNIPTEQSLFDPLKEQHFIQQLKQDDLLFCTIRPFDVGNTQSQKIIINYFLGVNYTCTDEELGNGAFSQVIAC